MHGLIHLLFQSRTKVHHPGWSVGICNHCGQLEVWRLENLIRIFCICFIPISRTVVGKRWRCDFCERLASAPIVVKYVPLDDWIPLDGLPALLKRLDLNPSLAPSAGSSETRMRSLLTSLNDKEWLKKTDSGVGMVTGMIVGFLAGIG